jgi:hypothetical protein
MYCRRLSVQSSFSRVLNVLAFFVATGVAGLAFQARAQSPNDGLPIPATTKDSLTAIQRTFELPVPPPLALFPEMREQLKDAPAFLRDSKVEFNDRSYYRDNVAASPTKTTVNEAWAGGGAGSVNFESGRLFDIVSGGFTLYNSFPIYAPYQYGNTQLLLPDQQGYTVVGQLYGRLRLTDDTYITAGRSSWTTPYLNPHDNRMTPNTFYGYVLQGSIGDPDSGKPAVRFGGGYIAAIKPRDAVDFQSMAQAAGVNRSAGVGSAGALLTWGPVSIGGIDYFCQDTINIAYAEGIYGANLPLGLRAVLAMQYADQRSTGANLLNGGSYWSTGQVGTRLQLGYQTTILTVGFSAGRHSACPAWPPPSTTTMERPTRPQPASHWSRANGTSVLNGVRTGSRCRACGSARAMATPKPIRTMLAPRPTRSASCSTTTSSSTDLGALAPLPALLRVACVAGQQVALFPLAPPV